MANDLNNSALCLHQTLHGYADGHRLIASSTNLKSTDLRTMLIMSDVSGPGAIIDKNGYLTGYPLPESGFYALSRTWAATEMTRPGCVWTHTLLVDFADLALLSNMQFLLSKFRRPTDKKSQIGYDNVIKIPNSPYVPREFNNQILDSLKNIIWALYKHPNDGIVTSSDQNSSMLVFLIWEQQWPRLRRSFRFCTLSFADRSGEGRIFDLQFVAKHQRSFRSRFPKLVKAEQLKPISEDWLEEALIDLSEGSDGGLRIFLRNVGGDITGGRKIFAPLCQLYLLLKGSTNVPSSIDKAVALFNESFKNEPANSIRASIVSEAANCPEKIGDQAFSFLLRYIELLHDDIHEKAGRLGIALWRRDPSVLEKFFTGKHPRPLIAERALAELSVSELMHGLRRNPHSIPFLLSHRTEIVTEPKLWSIQGNWIDAGLAVVAQNQQLIESTLTAMLAAERRDLAGEAVNAFGGGEVLKAISQSLSINETESLSETTLEWLNASLVDGGVIAKALGSLSGWHLPLLVSIAYKTEPDFVINDYGKDPWLIAMSSAKGSISKKERQYLYAYLFVRAICNRSRNQTDLFALVFDDIHNAISNSNFNDNAWSLIEPHLPWIMLFLAWDRCHRLRLAVINAFIDQSLSPLAFANLTDDDQIFCQLAETALRKGYKGKQFLIKVRHALINLDSNHLSVRNKILEKYLNRKY